MAVSNSLVKQEQDKKQGITSFLSSQAVQKQIADVVGGKNGTRFITSVVSAVNTTPALMECTNTSIFSAALLGESLNLSPSPQLGQFYMVPFSDKTKGKVAQFILGYKGLIQLALRSGQYRKLNVIAIKEGELISYNPLEEEINVKLIEDENVREQTPTIGYYAFFEYLNGFRKTLYWSKEKMINHADRYSAAFSKNATRGKYPKVSYADYLAGNYDAGTEWQYSSFWYKDFDGMAYKTMLRQIITKWGVMSIDLQIAIDADTAVINEDGTASYVEPMDTYIQESTPPMIEAHEVPEASTKQETNTKANPAAALFGK